MADLRIDNLAREVNGRTILHGVSFAAPEGVLIAIVGPSGSGKSSLLRLVNRLDEPSEGTVFLDGRDYRTISPRELRRRAGMVMQRPWLFPGTVAANLRFGPRQWGEALSDDDVERLLERVELGGFSTRTVEKLSGGEAQRVSIARTLANRPEVLLLDEPTSALDEALALQVERLIAGVIRQQRLTCLFVTHDREQARRLADWVLVLEGGVITAAGTAEEVIGASEPSA